MAVIQQLSNERRMALKGGGVRAGGGNIENFKKAAAAGKEKVINDKEK